MVSWPRLIREALLRRASPLDPDEHMGLIIGSASEPQFYRADGKRWAVKLRFQDKGHGGGHGLTAERIVGLAGALLGAPVPEVQLISIDPNWLPTANDMNGASVPFAGLHHASSWHDGFGDKASLAYVAENRVALGALDVLYTCCIARATIN